MGVCDVIVGVGFCGGDCVFDVVDFNLFGVFGV